MRVLSLPPATLTARCLACAVLACAAIPVALPAQGFDYASYRPYESRIEPVLALTAVGISDHFAVLVDATGSARTFDISDPLRPVQTDEIRLPPIIDDATVGGHHLLVCGRYGSENATTYLYEIGSDGRLHYRYSALLQGPGGHYMGGNGVAAWNDLVFVLGDRYPGAYPNIFIYRDTHEVYPGFSQIGLVLGPLQPLAVVMKGNRLFISSQWTGIAWFDFSDSGTVIAADTLAVGLESRAMTLAGNLLLAVDRRGVLDIIDTGGPSGPTVISSTPIGGTIDAIAVRGQVAFVADTYLGVRRIDITNTSAPVVLDTMYTPSGATDVEVVDRYLAVASRSDGLLMVDPARSYPRPLLGSSPWISGGFAVQGSMACGFGVVDGRNCVTLVDVSDATAPRLFDSAPFDFFAGSSSIAFSDSLVVVESYSGLGKFTIQVLRWDPATGFTDSAQFVLVGQLSGGAEIRGRQVYVAGYANSASHLWIYDVGDLRHIRLLQDLRLDFTPRAMVIQGETLWCGGGNSDGSVVCAIDVSVSGNAVIRSLAPVPRRIAGIAIQGDLLCTFDDGSLSLFDVSKPNSPVPLADLKLAGRGYAAILAGSTAYFAGTAGLKVVNVADPRHPELIGSVTGPFRYVAVGSGSLLASAYGGLLSFEEQSPAASPVSPVPEVPGGAMTLSPNPFNPKVSIALELRRPGRLVVQVFDVSGRLVADLLCADEPAGRLELVWDGRSSSGKEVPSGAYLVHADGPDGTIARKAMLVR